MAAELRSSSPCPAAEENARVVDVLDDLDRCEQLRGVLAQQLSGGFMAIAAERYTNKTAALTLSRHGFDERSFDATLVVDSLLNVTDRRRASPPPRAGGGAGDEGRGGMRRRRAHADGNAPAERGDEADEEKAAAAQGNGPSFGGVLPSAEMREARKCFQMSVRTAAELARINRQLAEKCDRLETWRPSNTPASVRCTAPNSAAQR